MSSTNHNFRDLETMPIRPLKAWRHFRNLIANKEDTEQVFHIINLLSGNSQNKQYYKFAASQMGQARLADQIYLPPLLDDHEALLKLPEGSLGRAYVEFMQKEGLTAQGLVDEYENFDTGYMEQYPASVQWYFNRRRDTHDLLHILTGYGRDALGEASLLAYSFAVNKGLGVAFIAYGAGLELRKSAPKEAKIMSAVHEGYKIGKTSADIINYDIMALLPQPLDSVRAMLGITPPRAYHRAHKIIRNHGLDPYKMIEPQQADTKLKTLNA